MNYITVAIAILISGCTVTPDKQPDMICHDLAGGYDYEVMASEISGRFGEEVTFRDDYGVTRTIASGDKTFMLCRNWSKP